MRRDSPYRTLEDLVKTGHSDQRVKTQTALSHQSRFWSFHHDACGDPAVETGPWMKSEKSGDFFIM